MAKTDACIFCDIIAGTLPSAVIFQDEEILVIKNLYPNAPIHWLIMPKVHVTEFAEAPLPLIGRIHKVAQRLINTEKISGYRLTMNGAGAAHVKHLHLHLMGGVEKARDL